MVRPGYAKRAVRSPGQERMTISSTELEKLQEAFGPLKNDREIAQVYVGVVIAGSGDLRGAKLLERDIREAHRSLEALDEYYERRRGELLHRLSNLNFFIDQLCKKNGGL